eukprot:scaffold394613_cov44-Prasinocladus_malaysianus.AAC.1
MKLSNERLIGSRNGDGQMPEREKASIRNTGLPKPKKLAMKSLPYDRKSRPSLSLVTQPR